MPAVSTKLITNHLFSCMPSKEEARSGEGEEKNFFEDLALVDKAKELVKNSYKAASDNQSSFFDNFRKYYELYRGVQSNKHYQGRANLFIPEAFTNLESIHARIVQSFQGIKAKPQVPDDVENSKTAELLLEYQNRVYNLKQAFKDQCKDALMYGLGVIKVSWNLSKDGKFDHPVLSCIDPGTYYFDPDAVDRAESRFEIHESYQTIGELEKSGKYDEEALKTLKERKTEATSGNSSLENDRRGAIGAQSLSHKGKHHILEFWGLFEYEDGEEEEFIITLADGEVVIRLEENPFIKLFEDAIVDEKMVRPFVVMKGIDVPHEFYGVGIIEPIVRLIEELNDTRNQRMDNVTLIIDQMYEVNDNADIDENELVARPGGIVHSAVQGGIIPIQRGDVTASAYNEEQIIKQDIQKAIGLPDVATGSLEGAKGEHAATILSLQESANIRFNVLVSQFADSVRHAFSLVLAYDQEYQDKEVIVRVTGKNGEEFKQVDKDSIRGKFDLDVQMETQMNKIVRRQEAFALYDRLAVNPMINQEINTKTLLETMDRKDIEELMTLPPPAPKEPEEPKKTINVSLKGDLNALESDDLAVIMGAKQESADPLLRQDMRMLMNGQMPENEEKDLKKMELEEKFMEEKRLGERELKELDYKNNELDFKREELEYKKSALKQPTQPVL